MERTQNWPAPNLWAELKVHQEKGPSQAEFPLHKSIIFMAAAGLPWFLLNHPESAHPSCTGMRVGLDMAGMTIVIYL